MISESWISILTPDKLTQNTIFLINGFRIDFKTVHAGQWQLLLQLELFFFLFFLA